MLCKRIMCTLLTASLVWGSFPATALASDTSSEQPISVDTQEVLESSVNIAGTNDDLLGGYVQEHVTDLLSEESASSEDEDALSVSAQSAHSALSGNDLVAYEAIRDLVAQVAAGTLASTEFQISLEDVGYDGPWTASQLGVSAIVEDGKIAQSAVTAANQRLSVDFEKVVDALLSDCPYDLYWFDKTAGYAFANTSGYGADWNGTEYVLYPKSGPRVSLYVASEYSATGAANTTTVNQALAQSVNTAIANVAQVVTNNNGKPAFERLKAYSDYICGEVSYNHDAANNTNTSYGNPWQLIWVFDGDTSTNVVCEGYAKAFKYLCDLTWPNTDEAPVECLLASGVMTGGTGAGRHMWNVVRMDDGNNYLVDVTNCDTGTIGYPDELFMAYGPSGSYADGYTFTPNGHDISFVYSDETKGLLGESALTISSVEYQEPVLTSIAIADAVVTVPSPIVYDGTNKEPAPTVSLAGVDLIEGVDFTCAYENNVNAGTATLVVTGVGSYEGSVSTTFEILPASIAGADVTLQAESFVFSGSPKAPSIQSVSLNGTLLEQGVDYEVAVPTQCVDAGVYTCTVRGIGNYRGTAAASFEITPASIASVKPTLSAFSFAWTGGVRRPSVRCVLGGKALAAGTDFSLEWSAVSPVAVGTYRVRAVGLGNCTGASAWASFDIVPKATAMSGLTATTSALTASWKSQLQQADGYQLQVSTSKSFSAPRLVSVSGARTTSQRVSGLKAKTTYYVRVRTTKAVGGRTYYSAWSAAKSTTTR